MVLQRFIIILIVVVVVVVVLALVLKGAYLPNKPSYFVFLFFILSTEAGLA